MAGVQWQVRTFGDLTVFRKLMKMARQADDLSDAWPAVVEIAARGYDNSYELEGPGWADLRPATKVRKEKGGFGIYPIRHRTGEDRRYMTNPSNLRYRGTRHTVDIWAHGDTPAEIHQEGSLRMVARPLLLTRYFQDQMSLAIRNTLSEAYDRG